MFLTNSTCLVLWCLYFTIKSASTQSCDYVKNQRVLYREGESDWKEITVNGCIDEATFNNIQATEINLECQNPKLDQIGPNFVNNIKSVEKLFITQCKFETIEPGAFSNLPRLREITIDYNPLKSIRKGVFDGVPSLTHIHIRFSDLSYIEDDAFANLPNLNLLNLNNNQCEFMRKEWFTNTTGMRTFLMARNSLRQIPPGMFEGWRNLEWFNLNENKITVIHDRAFKDIAPVIKNLDLHVNRLTTISPNSFSNPAHIETLRLSGNLFNYLSEEFIRKVNAKYLYIHGNPFKCGCLDRLNWLLQEKGDVIVDNPLDPYVFKPCFSEAAPVCVVPLRFKYCQDTVDPEVTRTYLTYLKKIGYDQMGKCAMFDELSI